MVLSMGSNYGEIYVKEFLLVLLKTPFELDDWSSRVGVIDIK